MEDFRCRCGENPGSCSNENPSSLAEIGIGYAKRVHQNCCHRLQGGIVIRMSY